MGWIAETLASAIREPDNRPMDEWAEDMIRFPGSPISEAFKRENIPMLIEPMRSWDDPLTRSVSVLAGVQGCKTGFEQIAIARAMSTRPGNMLLTAQTDKEAEFYVRTKLLPFLRSSQATKNMMRLLGRDDVTKEHIILPSMFVQIQGPSLSGAQSKTIWYLLNEEMWMWKKGTHDQLLRRTNAVRNKKILSVAQGGRQIETERGEPDWCEWGSWWHQGTQKWFEVRCPACEKFFGPETRIYPKGKYIICWDDTPDTRNQETKEWNWKAVRQTVRMQCPHCDKPIQNRERDRKALVQDWQYRATNDNPSPAHESYRYSGWSLWWRDWADIVELKLRAHDALLRGDIDPLMQFTQKEEARFWTLADEEIPAINTKGASGYRIETYEPKEGEEILRIENEEHRFATIDFQQDRFPTLIRAFGGGRSRMLFYEEPKTVEDVDAIMKQYGLQTGHIGFDVGNWRKDALKFCLKYGWAPLRGRDIGNFTKTRGKRVPVKTYWQTVKEYLTGEKGMEHGKVIPVFEWSNTYFKDIFSRLRAMPEHEIPDDVPQIYLDAMESEAKDSKGIWRQIGKKANHPWDCEAMATFMAFRYNLVGSPDVPETEEEESDEEH